MLGSLALGAASWSAAGADDTRLNRQAKQTGKHTDTPASCIPSHLNYHSGKEAWQHAQDLFDGAEGVTACRMEPAASTFSRDIAEGS